MAGKFKWQQNLRSIPPGILRAVASFGKKDCLVACMSKITETQLKHGDFDHVGIQWGKDGPKYEPNVLPRPDVGRYSRRNVRVNVKVYEWQLVLRLLDAKKIREPERIVPSFFCKMEPIPSKTAGNYRKLRTLSQRVG